MFNILVVDDDELVTRALSTLLRRPGRRVLTCTDPCKVQELMTAQTVDLVISDEDMPGLSGVRLLSMLRKSHPDAVRILLTGRGTVQTAVDAINEGGVFKFLTKPWDQKELDAVVASALETVQAKRKPPKPPVALDRRRAMLEELEREHPGLLTVGTSPHLVIVDPMADSFDRLVAGVLARDTLRADTVRRHAEPAAAQAGPLAVANALAAVMLRQPCNSLVIEPRDAGHVVSIEAGVHSHILMTLPRALGDTVVARFGVLGGLDIGGMGEQVGRTILRLGNDESEFLITFRTNPMGLAVELRRVGTIEIEVEPAPSASSPNGDFIGRYRILDVIGHGGLGVVHRGVHEALERPVAVKLLHSHAQDEMATARFLREARAASRARHSGIVEVLDFGQCADGRAFLVMELVEAPTLEHRLSDGAFPLEQAVTIAGWIAAALGAAHDAGVIHRDLKPSNVFVDDDLTVKLSDFGAAKIIGLAGPELTQEGTTVGTPHYMSPEHARGLQVDRRTDLYALGCVLYEMVSGKPPFEGQTALDVLTQHIGTPPPTPVSPHGPVPHALSRCIRRAMAKNPGERHQTAAELIADLAQAGSSLGRTGWRRWLP